MDFANFAAVEFVGAIEAQRASRAEAAQVAACCGGSCAARPNGAARRSAPPGERPTKPRAARRINDNDSQRRLRPAGAD